MTNQITTDFKVYKRKIHIYVFYVGKGWQYACSTNASKTCKEAVDRFCTVNNINKAQCKASFQSK